MTQYTEQYGDYVVTVYGKGVAVAIQFESITGELYDRAFLQGDEAAELVELLDGAEPTSCDVEAMLAEY